MKKKIMVVDDDHDNSFSLKVRLEEMDSEYEVTCIDGGKQCLEWLENNKVPDLILLDIMMPEMSGWETLDKLKKNLSWRDIPVVFLTARIDEVAENAGKFLGEDYIEKPYTVRDVKKRIDKILKNTG